MNRFGSGLNTTRTQKVETGCDHRAASEAIAQAAIQSVDPTSMITRSLLLEESVLQIQTATGSYTVDLADYERVIVVGAGKAGAAMARGLESVLGDWISEGVVAVKSGFAGASTGAGARAGVGVGVHAGAGVERTVRERNVPRKIRLLEAGHPVPDASSVAAAREVAKLAESADAHTLCFALISGGGSALLTLPAAHGSLRLTLEDIQTTTRLLLRAGTPIGEINCVRKHLSGISGGRFCEMVAPASLVALILSDVVGDHLGSIASGLTAPDEGTYEDACRICRRYGIEEQLPSRVREMLTGGVRGDLPETPKPGDPVFERVHPFILGSNAVALDAARQRAEELGYNTLVLTSRITGEAREVARVFAAIAADLAVREIPLRKPACVLAGGETTVTIQGDGKGGRNQEMALAFLEQIALCPEAFPGVGFLSVGTDGNDGPTDAAGAWATPELAEGSSPQEISEALHANDSYHFFKALGGLLITGPTETNVCDIQILLVE